MVSQLWWWVVFLSVSIWLVYLLLHPSTWGAWLPHTPQGRTVLNVVAVCLNVFAAYRLWRKGAGFSRWITPALLAVLIVANRLF
jgi:hypothetical protein